jgi:hypothetical protein
MLDAHCQACDPDGSDTVAAAQCANFVQSGQLSPKGADAKTCYACAAQLRGVAAAMVWLCIWAAVLHVRH